MIRFGFVTFGLLLFALPLLGGMIGVLLPAFGYFPPLGYEGISLLPAALFWAHPHALTALFQSLYIGLTATALSVVFVFLCLALEQEHRAVHHMMKVVRVMLGPLIALPHSTIAIALLFLLAPSGWLARLISPELTGWMRPPAFGFVPDQSGGVLILGLMAKEIPFLLFVALAQSQSLPVTRLLTLGRLHGYHGVASWLYLIWPQLYPLLRLPLFAVLAYALSVIDMTLILGPTLPPPLAGLILQGFTDPDLASRLPASFAAFLQLVLIIAGMMMWVGVAKLCRHGSHMLRHHQWRMRSISLVTLPPLMILGFSFVLLALGLIAIGLWAFAKSWPFSAKLPQSYGLHLWRDSAEWGLLFAQSFVIAVAASLSSIGLSLLWLEGRNWHRRSLSVMTLLLFIPLLVPQISLLFGLQVALSYLYLDGKWLTVIWLHTLYCLPYSWLVLAPALIHFDRRYITLARSLGSGPWRCFWRVKLPMIAPSLASAFSIGIAVSVALYLPTLFAGAGRIDTVTTEAVTAAANGARGGAARAALMQMALPLLGFLAVSFFLRWQQAPKKQA